MFLSIRQSVTFSSHTCMLPAEQHNIIAHIFIRTLRWENGCENGRYVRGFPYNFVLRSTMYTYILLCACTNVFVMYDRKKKRFLIFMLASQVSCWWQRITEYMSEYKRILHKYKHIPSVWQLWLFIITSIWLEHCHCQTLCVLCGIWKIVWNSIFWWSKSEYVQFYLIFVVVFFRRCIQIQNWLHHFT